MKRTIFLLLINSFLLPATASASSEISVEGTYVQITDDKNSGLTTFTHSIETIRTGQEGGTLTIYYNGDQASAKSTIDIGEITGSGDLVLEGSSINTLKLFRLSKKGVSSFSGNLTICNYSAMWDPAKIHDTAAVLELSCPSLAGSISLDAVGYCAADSFFITAVGINGDVSMGGLDAPDYIAPAAYLYSGQIKENTTHLDHKSGLGSYIDAMHHTLTIDTAGTHHYHGKVITPLSIVKKGKGTQKFTGTFAAGSNFQVLGGNLHLAADIEANKIDLQSAELNHTGMLHTATLNMLNGILNVSETFTADSARFSGANTLTAGPAEGTNWIIDLSSTNKEQASITLRNATGVNLDYLNILYDKAHLLRGWYQLVSNNSAFSAVQIQANGNAARTETRNNALWLYVADGELTQSRAETTLTWQANSGTWETGKGHADMNWNGPDINSNFLAGDHVCFSNAATVNPAGDLQPGSIYVSNSCGTVTLEGSGSISGAASLSKTGDGELRIATANTFTGGTALSAGTLRTLHPTALGSGDILLHGGILDMSKQSVTNSLHVHGDSEIRGAQQYEGQLVVHSGTLRGEDIQLKQTAQLLGGEIVAGLIGNAGLHVQGNVSLSGLSSYTGATTINTGSLSIKNEKALGNSTVIIQGGQLDLNHLTINNSIQICNHATIVHADNFCGNIELQNGILQTETLGNATLSCSGNSTLHAESTLKMRRAINNTGTLNLQGCFNLDALGQSFEASLVDAFGKQNNHNGFQRDSGTHITLTSGNGSVTGDAEFTYLGSSVNIDSNGQCILGATTHYGHYQISEGHEVAVSDILKASGNSLHSITMHGGKLNADANAYINATGGNIQLSAGEINGSCSNSQITATGGVLNLEFSGENHVIASACTRITELIRNTGTLNLQGELDASALNLQEQPATRTGGTSPASGYARTAEYSLQVITGGSITGGATIIHHAHRLTLNTDGYAYAGGEIDYSEYLLTGSDTARTSTLKHPGLQSIRMTGGTLTVDCDTALLNATGGTIILEQGNLSSNINGHTTIRITGAGTLSGTNTHTGSILLDNGQLTLASPGALGAGSLTATGNSSLAAEGFTLVLQKPIENSGNLTLHGHFDATALAKSTAATMVDAYGNEGGQSGFLRDAGCKAQLTTGGSLNTANATILLHGKSVKADAGGKISHPGTLHTDVYKITGEHSVSSSAIMEAAGECMPVIRMNSGTLLVNKSTDNLQACGGLVQIETARLGGSLSSDTQVEILGNAIITGNNTHTGGTTLATGSLKVEHAHALGTGAVHLGSRARAAAPLLDLGNLHVNNHLHLYGSSELCGLENFSGSITMSSGAETTIRHGEVFNLRPGQTLTLAPGGNTIHGHVNLNGGTIILTGGGLTLDGVVHFTKPTTIDLSQWSTLDDEMVIFNFPSLYDEEMVQLILPAHLENEQISLNQQTGALQIAPVTQPQNLTHALNRNQQAVYKTLRGIDPASVSGELTILVEKATTCPETTEIRQLMDSAGGAGYTALINSMADDALAHLHQLRRSAGTAQQISPQHNTAVGIYAYNHTGSMDGSPGYERSAWGGRLMLEHRATPKLTLGLTLENGITRITPDADDTQNDTATHAAVYALYSGTKWHTLLAAGFGMHEFSLSRTLADGSSAEVEHTGGNTINFAAKVTRSFKLTRHSQLCPYLALQSTCATCDAFHENGSSASLHAEEQHITLTELNLGVLYEATLANSLLLNLHGELIATFGDMESEIEMHFEGAPEHDFTQYGPKRGSLGYQLGLSLALPLTPDCSLHAAASARMQNHEQNINSQLGILLHF